MRYWSVAPIVLLVMVACSRSECCQGGDIKLVARAPLRVSQIGQELALQVAGDVVAPVLIKKVEPTLPDHERTRVRTQPTMLFELTIDRSGNVAAVRTVRTNDRTLLPYVLAAIKEWKYRPATLHGHPVRVVYNVRFSYDVR